MLPTVNLTAEQKKQAHFVATECLKQIITDFNVFFQLKEKEKEIPLEILRTSITDKKEEIEENLSYINYYTINHFFINRFFEEDFDRARYSFYRIELRKLNMLAGEDEFNTITNSLFAAFVANFIQMSYESTIEEEIHQKILVFDQVLFDQCWRTLIPWISSEPLVFRVLYPIFNMHYNHEKGKTLKITETLRLITPSDEQRKSLADSLYLRPLKPSQITWIKICDAWVEGELSIPVAKLNNSQLSTEIEVMSPTIIEEVFALLGMADVIVTNFIMNAGVAIKKLFMTINEDGTVECVIDYPRWMDNSMKHERSYLASNEEILNFLVNYINSRQRGASHIFFLFLNKSLTDYIRCYKSPFIQDTISLCLQNINQLLNLKNEGKLGFALTISWFLGRNYHEREVITTFCHFLYTLNEKMDKKEDSSQLIATYEDLIVKLSRTLFQLVLISYLNITNNQITLYDSQRITIEANGLRLGGSRNIDLEKNFIYRRQILLFLEDITQLKL